MFNSKSNYKMQHKTYFLDAFDGRKMFFNQWEGENAPKTNIVLIHGMGEHSGRYRNFAKFFTENGINVYAVDLFGHGKTDGKRGHTPKMDDYLWQVGFIINMIKQLKAPVILYGHSMGGGIVLNYLFKKNPEINGVIASAPAIKPAFEVPKWKLALGNIGKLIAPALTQTNGLNVDGVSRDKTVVDHYRADPLNHDIISAEVGMGVLEWGNWLLETDLKNPSASLLLMHGDADLLTSYSASKQFIEKFQAGDISFKTWPGLYHELHNEPEKEHVFKFIFNWIESRI